MKNILDIVDDYIIIIDGSGVIQFCNKKLLAKLEYNLGELKNIRIEEILYNKNEDLNIGIKKINRENNVKIDLDLCTRYGEKISVYSEMVVEKFNDEESIVIASRDICEKSYKREDLEKILDSVPFDCWLKNTNGDYVYVNESYARQLKNDRLSILGNNASKYWNKDMCNSFAKMDREVITSKKYQLTEDYTQREDSDLWVEIYKGPIVNKHNEVEYIIGFTKDITLQKKLENEMHVNNREMNNLNNILMKTNTKDNVNGLLKNVCENILDYIECDSVAVLSVNEEKPGLDITLNVGKTDKYKVSDELLKFGLANRNNLSGFNYINNISNIKDVKNEELKKHMYINNIENIGIYDISFNDEAIGFLVLTFLENNTLKFNKFDYLKTISGNIATMIKSHTLSKSLQEEFEKRSQIESELELLLDISVDLIARGSANGRMKHINSNWSKTLGWTEEELLSMNMIDIIHPDNKNECKSILQGLKSDFGCIVSKLICKDGSYKWVELNYKIIRDEDKLIITAKDISEQRKQEDERKILEEAIQMESLKNEFFANISHEFRTPLNIILGTMQLMQRNVDKNKISWDSSLNLEDHINYIKQNSYRLLRLVNNLIDITCIDSGYYQLQLGNYNIVDIVENITLSVAQYIKDQGVNFIFDTDSEEKIIACDPDKIERIVLNLLSNAIKYTDKDGYIYVELQVEDDRVKVSVKDSGVGMSKDKLDVIFDRFKKIDNNLNRKCEGSGIGLSLVKSLVEMQGGEVYVNSELGLGSEFIFELPDRLTKDNSKIISDRDISKVTQIEKCNIEFSDIYS